MGIKKIEQMKIRLIFGIFLLMGVTAFSQDTIRANGDFIAFDKKASFKKGKLENYLLKNLNFPKKSIASGAQGYVLLSFTITKNGTLENIIPIEYPNEELAQTSIMNFISTDSLWNPTILFDRPISHKYLIAYKYSIYLNESPLEYLKEAAKYQEQKDFDRALQFCDKEISENKYNSAAYLKRSEIKSSLGDTKGSKQDLSKYEELRSQLVGNINVSVIGISKDRKL